MNGASDFVCVGLSGMRAFWRMRYVLRYRVVLPSEDDPSTGHVEHAWALTGDMSFSTFGPTREACYAELQRQVAGYNRRERW